MLRFDFEQSNNDLHLHLGALGKMLCIFMLNCTRDSGLLALNSIYMHPNSVFPLCVNNGSALAELLHCAVRSGRAPMQRASCRFRLRKAVTLTAPRGTGREI